MFAAVGRPALARELQRASRNAVASCSRSAHAIAPQSTRLDHGADQSARRRRDVRSFATTSAILAEPMQSTEATAENSQVQSSLDDIEGDGAPSELGTESPEGQQEEADAQAQQELRQGGGGSGALPPFRQWVKNQGKRAFENPPPGRGPFWIGETPFPLNPSFQPPAPLGRSIKTAMRDLHRSDPHKNSVHVLASRFHVPIERVVAVLRLMALEAEQVKQGKPLQTVFQKEMERLLGASTRPDAIEKEAAEMSEAKGARGAVPREEVGPNETAGYISPITGALAIEAKERDMRYRTLPTGSPSTYGPPPEQSTVAHKSTRAPMTYVDLSPRPSSYRGAGVIARNEARAARRHQNKVNRKAVAEEARRLFLEERSKASALRRQQAAELAKSKNPYLI